MSRPVTVLERQPGEGIKAWVDRAGEAVGLDHSLISRECRERKCDLKIPLFEDAASIGMAGKEKLSKESMDALNAQLKK
jgi:hypothetical protein